MNINLYRILALEQFGVHESVECICRHCILLCRDPRHNSDLHIKSRNLDPYVNELGKLERWNLTIELPHIPLILACESLVQRQN